MSKSFWLGFASVFNPNFTEQDPELTSFTKAQRKQLVRGAHIFRWLIVLASLAAAVFLGYEKA